MNPPVQWQKKFKLKITLNLQSWNSSVDNMHYRGPIKLNMRQGNFIWRIMWAIVHVIPGTSCGDLILKMVETSWMAAATITVMCMCQVSTKYWTFDYFHCECLFSAMKWACDVPNVLEYKSVWWKIDRRAKINICTLSNALSAKEAQVWILKRSSMQRSIFILEVKVC